MQNEEMRRNLEDTGAAALRPADSSAPPPAPRRPLYTARPLRPASCPPTFIHLHHRRDAPANHHLLPALTGLGSAPLLCGK